MKCPKCGSENCAVQMVSETSVKQKHHGIIYWLCGGWLLQLLLWIFLTLPMLIVAIFKPKKYKVKTKTSKVALCNECGNSWNIK